MSTTDELYMAEALKVAKRALTLGEVPVGCVIVLEEGGVSPSLAQSPTFPTPKDDDENDTGNITTSNRNNNHIESVIISHGANQVNATRDATRHAEIVAIDRLLTQSRSTDQLRLPLETTIRKARLETTVNNNNNNNNSNSTTTTTNTEELAKVWHDKWINVPEDPNHWKNKYGWRSNTDGIHPQPVQQSEPLLNSVDIFKHCCLYVTCEPCIMCAAALATVGIRRVVFGCRNDRFGGNGSLLHLHEAEEEKKPTTKSSPPSPMPATITNTNRDRNSTITRSQGYEITPGVLEEEAIALLRSFYERENFHAPDDKRKRKEPSG